MATINGWTCISYTHATNKSPNSTCPSRFLWVQVLAENGGQSYPFWPRSKHWLIRHRHIWIKRPPEKKFSRTRAQTTTINKWTPEAAQPKKEKVGGPTGRPADLPMGPAALSLRRGSSSLDNEVGSRWFMHNSRPRRGWLPSIYMRGGAPFQASNLSSQNTSSKQSSYSLKM